MGSDSTSVSTCPPAGMAGRSSASLGRCRRIGRGALVLAGILGLWLGAADESRGRDRGVAGPTPVRFFETQGKGYKFVYVLDRSGSMGGSGTKALRAAKAELIASLEGIDRTRQFQIIFYNEEPCQFNPAGQTGRLGFGTDQNRRLARRFIEGIAAVGGTEHEAALKMALRMKPDVIFWLTDADEPRLSPQQVRQLARVAEGVTIHAVEFGPGPRPGKDSFLKRMAEATGGQYRYVNVSRLKDERVARP